jgi:hypothetical protein
MADVAMQATQTLGASFSRESATTLALGKLENDGAVQGLTGGSSDGKGWATAMLGRGCDGV